jgi:hypothetical protein
MAGARIPQEGQGQADRAPNASLHVGKPKDMWANPRRLASDRVVQ